MKTEKLTPDEMLRKWSEITYPNLNEIARISFQNAMRAYADQEVEYKTKQLQEERDQATALLIRIEKSGCKLNSMRDPGLNLSVCYYVNQLNHKNEY